MAKWRVIETREDLVTIERLGSAGMVSMPPAELGLKSGHEIALDATVWGEEGAFRLSEAEPPVSEPASEPVPVSEPASEPAGEGDSDGG